VYRLHDNRRLLQVLLYRRSRENVKNEHPFLEHPFTPSCVALPKITSPTPILAGSAAHGIT
jgi:hypothetical protein